MKKLSGLSLLATLLFSGAAIAQQRATLIAGAGVAIGSAGAAGTIPVYANDPDCGTYGDASSMPIAPSLSLRLPSIFVDDIGLAIRLGYVTQTFEHTATPIDPQRAVDPQTGALVDVERQIRLDASFGAVALDILGAVTFGAPARGYGGLSIGVGPSIAFAVGGEDVARDAIAGPSHASFRGGERERDVTSGSVLTRSSLQLAGVLDVAYAFALGTRLHLAPHADVRVSFVSLYSEHSVKPLAFGGGLDLLFDLTATPEPPTVVVVPPSPLPELTATLQLFGVDSAGNRTAVVAAPIEEIVERQTVPLVPAVFFDSAATILPARLRRLPPAELHEYDPARAVSANAVEVQRELLNIVGYRLAKDPSARLTIVGGSSADEPRAIRAARAEAIAGYLRSVWSVEANRIAIAETGGSMAPANEAVSEGRAENRRAELVSASDALLAPLSGERVIQQGSRAVALEAAISSNMPVASLSGSASTGGSGVVAIASTRPAGVTDLLETISIPASMIGSTTRAIETRLTVRDTAGRTRALTASIPVVPSRTRTVIEGATERTADRERSTWQILGFNYNSPELTERHRDEVAAIAGSIGAGARIVVTGYSDRLGDAQRNVELSRERADRVAAELRAAIDARGRSGVAIESLGAGVDESRFTNALPEGRILSRGVTIVVEQSGR